MSLEWARARLLAHREALRKLCEARAPAAARQPAAPPRGPGNPAVAELPRLPRVRSPLGEDAERGTLLRFEQRIRRRRA